MVDQAQTPPEGTTGEPEVPAAAGSQDGINLDELVENLKPEQAQASPAPAIDEEFAKRLESLDPTSLPEGLRRKLENPFLSQYTKKTTEWDDKEKRYLAAIEKLSSQRVDPAQTEDQKESIRQRILDGDMTAIDGLVDQRLEQKYGADIQNVRLNGAMDNAERLFPGTKTMEPAISQVIAANPGIAPYIANALNNNPAVAGMMLASIARGLRYEQVVAENNSLKQSQKSIGKAAIEEYKKRVAGLPSSTSRAGSTPSRGPAEGNLTLRQSLEAAYDSTFGAGS